VNRLEAGAFSQPPGGGGGVGRCVSARTRERSDQPLPLHPAIAIRLRRMANVLGGGGEWSWLAEHWQAICLQAICLQAICLQAICLQALCRFAIGECKQPQAIGAAGNSPQANPPLLLPRGVYKLRAE
jgi:hypothetical protein